MTQSIDLVKLKAAAEHLEWVLKQYPDSEVIRGLLDGLLPLIEEAKAGKTLEPREKIPFAYSFSDGTYVPYNEPDVESAYYEFAAEMRGGRSEQEKRIIDRVARMAAGAKP